MNWLIVLMYYYFSSFAYHDLNWPPRYVCWNCETSPSPERFDASSPFLHFPFLSIPTIDCYHLNYHVYWYGFMNVVCWFSNLLYLYFIYFLIIILNSCLYWKLFFIVFMNHLWFFHYPISFLLYHHSRFKIFGLIFKIILIVFPMISGSVNRELLRISEMCKLYQG